MRKDNFFITTHCCSLKDKGVKEETVSTIRGQDCTHRNEERIFFLSKIHLLFQMSKRRCYKEAVYEMFYSLFSFINLTHLGPLLIKVCVADRNPQA